MPTPFLFSRSKKIKRQISTIHQAPTLQLIQSIKSVQYEGYLGFPTALRPDAGLACSCATSTGHERLTAATSAKAADYHVQHTDEEGNSPKK